jgi:hypothetical protein
MGMSKQTTFALACAVVFSALVPGLAGYLSARWEAVEAAERNLRALEAKLELREARDSRPVSFPAPCLRTPAVQWFRQGPATALGHPRHWPADVPAWPPRLLEEVSDAFRK